MKSKSLFIFFFLLSGFAMLTACGEGFESSVLEASQDPKKPIDEGRTGAPRGETDPSMDQQIFDSYLEESEAYGRNSSDQLAEKIYGIDLTMNLENQGADPDNQVFFVSVNMIHGEEVEIPNAKENEVKSCYIGDAVDISQGSVRAVDLRLMEPVSLGRSSDGKFEASFQCTFEDCSEGVILIRERETALALYAMKRISVANEAGQIVHRYHSRSSDVSGYYEALNNFFIATASIMDCEARLSKAPTPTGNTDLDTQDEDDPRLNENEWVPPFVGDEATL